MGLLSNKRFNIIFLYLITALFITGSSAYAADKPAKKVKSTKKPAKTSNTIISVDLLYRNSNKDLSISSSSKDSDVALTISRWQIGWKDEISVFLDIGAGIFKVNDPILFNSLTAPVNLQKYDGGRGFAYGGGIRGKIFEKADFKLNASANVTRFTNSSETTTLKVINSKAEASWLEYNVDMFLEYGGFKYIKPYIGTGYSNVDAKIKIKQTIQSLNTSQTNTLDENSSIGVFLGLNILPVKDILINLQGRLLNETGFLMSLGWTFREL